MQSQALIPSFFASSYLHELAPLARVLLFACVRAARLYGAGFASCKSSATGSNFVKKGRISPPLVLVLTGAVYGALVLPANLDVLDDAEGPDHRDGEDLTELRAVVVRGVCEGDSEVAVEKLVLTLGARGGREEVAPAAPLGKLVQAEGVGGVIERDVTHDEGDGGFRGGVLLFVEESAHGGFPFHNGGCRKFTSLSTEICEEFPAAPHGTALAI